MAAQSWPGLASFRTLLYLQTIPWARGEGRTKSRMRTRIIGTRSRSGRKGEKDTGQDSMSSPAAIVNESRMDSAWDLVLAIHMPPRHIIAGPRARSLEHGNNKYPLSGEGGEQGHSQFLSVVVIRSLQIWRRLEYSKVQRILLLP
ncbi:hypothetical protein B0H19DRAFT_23109 [Mycena capillaripes]|nr:hypothetical protein B0H19DRAFT_23109 [Mycena capillaripes]